jgi:hypothetical protein
MLSTTDLGAVIGVSREQPAVFNELVLRFLQFAESRHS